MLSWWRLNHPGDEITESCFRALIWTLSFLPLKTRWPCSSLPGVKHFNSLWQKLPKLVHEYEQPAHKMKNTVWWTELTSWVQVQRDVRKHQDLLRTRAVMSPLHSFILWKGKQMQQTSVAQRKKQNPFSITSIFLSLVYTFQTVQLLATIY